MNIYHSNNKPAGYLHILLSIHIFGSDHARYTIPVSSMTYGRALNWLLKDKDNEYQVSARGEAYIEGLRQLPLPVAELVPEPDWVTQATFQPR